MDDKQYRQIKYLLLDSVRATPGLSKNLLDLRDEIVNAKYSKIENADKVRYHKLTAIQKQELNEQLNNNAVKLGVILIRLFEVGKCSVSRAANQKGLKKSGK